MKREQRCEEVEMSSVASENTLTSKRQGATSQTLVQLALLPKGDDSLPWLRVPEILPSAISMHKDPLKRVQKLEHCKQFVNIANSLAPNLHNAAFRT